MKARFHLMRRTGTYAISTTLGESVQASCRMRCRPVTTFPTATAAVKVLEDLGIVAELTGQKKNRSYSYQQYIALLAL